MASEQGFRALDPEQQQSYALTPQRGVERKSGMEFAAGVAKDALSFGEVFLKNRKGDTVSYNNAFHRNMLELEQARADGHITGPAAATRARQLMNSYIASGGDAVELMTTYKAFRGEDVSGTFNQGNEEERAKRDALNQANKTLGTFFTLGTREADEALAAMQAQSAVRVQLESEKMGQELSGIEKKTASERIFREQGTANVLSAKAYLNGALSIIQEAGGVNDVSLNKLNEYITNMEMQNASVLNALQKRAFELGEDFDIEGVMSPLTDVVNFFKGLPKGKAEAYEDMIKARINYTTVQQLIWDSSSNGNRLTNLAALGKLVGDPAVAAGMMNVNASILLKTIEATEGNLNVYDKDTKEIIGLAINNLGKILNSSDEVSEESKGALLNVLTTALKETANNGFTGPNGISSKTWNTISQIAADPEAVKALIESGKLDERTKKRLQEETKQTFDNDVYPAMDKQLQKDLRNFYEGSWLDLDITERAVLKNLPGVENALGLYSPVFMDGKVKFIFNVDHWQKISEDMRKKVGHGINKESWRRLTDEAFGTLGNKLNGDVASALTQYVDLASLANGTSDKTLAFEELANHPDGFAGFTFWGEAYIPDTSTTETVQPDESSVEAPEGVSSPSEGGSGGVEPEAPVEPVKGLSVDMDKAELHARAGGERLPKDINKYDNIIERAAKEYNLPPLLIKAMIYQESSFKNEANSHAGAIGLMQLMPKTARDELGVTDINDPEQNIMAGARYLKKLNEHYFKDYTGKDKLEIILRAYNAGPTALNNILKETKGEKKYVGKAGGENHKYAEGVLSKFDMLKKLVG